MKQITIIALLVSVFWSNAVNAQSVYPERPAKAARDRDAAAP